MLPKHLLATLFLTTLAAPLAAQDYRASSYRERLPEDETIYFLLPDRFENGDTANDKGGFKGDRMKTGFDPASKGFFHGGDLKGLIQRLDYIQGLGATAIWLGPIFKNKPVQGGRGQESAGYHGYWITDFTQVDPHFGTGADMKALVDAAHARGMKVYMDIIANHTADVIAYRECQTDACPYRSRADYPYARKGGVTGAPINAGFAGDRILTQDNFAKLTDPGFAYSPYIPKGEENAKTPAWLNDPLLYHNRGNTTFSGESSTMGDFVGLDDLMTENPRVVQGMIDIYGAWIDTYGVDGFRIDTARHVNPEFWAAFVPAMLDRAKAKGIPHFHIFGEVAQDAMDPGTLARHTRVDAFPAVLDFAFRAAVIQAVGGTQGSGIFERLYFGDALYEGGTDAANRLPTFVSNHDAGRFAFYARKALPQASDAEILQRTELAHAMMLLLRGVPTIYSGDEQGFAGDGNDQDSREDMFPSKVAVYNDNVLLGTNKTTADANFDTGHPLYQAIARLAKLRGAHPALRRGKQIIRNYSDKPGIFAVSRIDPATGREILIAFNTATTQFDGHVEVAPESASFAPLIGTCPAAPVAPGSVKLSIPALGYLMCEAGK
ncbi:alpha-amylase family glycosyl hydrolase [Sphingobium algorifonticola]|uniref:Alpha-amylase n=1 Tax=Sphingobium algorifonticola TaxID=2008318 RepID=A0A437J8V7_9SPHN|nr:alpha-amylase family glycosyl hydrolase [Sphingobium algorifonticola]RVT41905.1 alpha-amylase [Sphingobium algorifonticola]